MGAFGVGPFENDDALDWLSVAIKKDFAKSVDKLFAMLARKSMKSFREDHCGQVVAAAALVAHAVKAQPPISRLLNHLKADPQILDGLASKDRIDAARAAIKRVGEPGNPLRQEWVDSGLVNQWEKELRRLDRILAGNLEYQVSDSATTKKATVMAKKAAKTKAARIESKWPEQMKEEVFFSQYLVVQQLRRYFNTSDRRGVISMISYLHILRIMLENLPVWPRNFKFERSEVKAWKARIVEHMAFVKSKLPVAYRDQFEKSVIDDLAFLADYMDRKRDPANDI